MKAILTQRNSLPEQGIGEPPAIRDFYYLDIEKIRSFVAQIREGLPEAFQGSNLRSVTGGLRLGINANAAYERTESETRSLHHHLYTILESALRDAGKLLEIDESFDDWDPGRLADGIFVLATGTISFLDFQTAADGLQGFPKIAEVAVRFALQSLKTQLDAGLLSKAQYQQAVNEAKQSSLPKKDVDDLAALIRDLYAGMIRMKMYPYSAEQSRYLAGTLLAEHLQRERPGVYATGQSSTEANWYVLGLIDRTRPAPGIPQQVGSGSLEDRIEALLSIMAGLGNLTVASEWPVVTFTPLAIYRLV